MNKKFLKNIILFPTIIASMITPLALSSCVNNISNSNNEIISNKSLVDNAILEFKKKQMSINDEGKKIFVKNINESNLSQYVDNFPNSNNDKLIINVSIINKNDKKGTIDVCVKFTSNGYTKEENLTITGFKQLDESQLIPLKPSIPTIPNDENLFPSITENCNGNSNTSNYVKVTIKNNHDTTKLQETIFKILKINNENISKELIESKFYILNKLDLKNKLAIINDTLIENVCCYKHFSEDFESINFNLLPSYPSFLEFEVTLKSNIDNNKFVKDRLNELVIETKIDLTKTSKNEKLKEITKSLNKLKPLNEFHQNGTNTIPFVETTEVNKITKLVDVNDDKNKEIIWKSLIGPTYEHETDLNFYESRIIQEHLLHIINFLEVNLNDCIGDIKIYFGKGSYFSNEMKIEVRILFSKDITINEWKFNPFNLDNHNKTYKRNETLNFLYRFSPWESKRDWDINDNQIINNQNKTIPNIKFDKFESNYNWSTKYNNNYIFKKTALVNLPIKAIHITQNDDPYQIYEEIEGEWLPISENMDTIFPTHIHPIINENTTYYDDIRKSDFICYDENQNALNDYFIDVNKIKKSPSLPVWQALYDFVPLDDSFMVNNTISKEQLLLQEQHGLLLTRNFINSTNESLDELVLLNTLDLDNVFHNKKAYLYYKNILFNETKSNAYSNLGKDLYDAEIQRILRMFIENNFGDVLDQIVFYKNNNDFTIQAKMGKDARKFIYSDELYITPIESNPSSKWVDIQKNDVIKVTLSQIQNNGYVKKAIDSFTSFKYHGINSEQYYNIFMNHKDTMINNYFPRQKNIDRFQTVPTTYLGKYNISASIYRNNKSIWSHSLTNSNLNSPILSDPKIIISYKNNKTIGIL